MPVSGEQLEYDFYKFFGLISLLVLSGLAVPTLYAQGLTSTASVSVFRYAEPGQPTKAIQVWGAVRSPGVYQVELDTGLLTVLTIAGGPATGMEDDRTVRNVTVQIIRDPSTARTVVAETTLEALTSEAVPMPDLQDGDLVSLTARSRTRFTWREALSITSTVASLAVLVLRLVE